MAPQAAQAALSPGFQTLTQKTWEGRSSTSAPVPGAVTVLPPPPHPSVFSVLCFYSFFTYSSQEPGSQHCTPVLKIRVTESLRDSVTCPRMAQRPRVWGSASLRAPRAGGPVICEKCRVGRHPRAGGRARRRRRVLGQAPRLHLDQLGRRPLVILSL